MIPRIHIEHLLERIGRIGAIIPENVFATLLLKGKDAQDLLHRLSTNDLRRIPEDGSARSVLTTEKGRIIDWIELRPGKDRLLVVCHVGAREKVGEWIEKFIIAEDVEVLRVSYDTLLTWIHFSPVESPAYGTAIRNMMGTYASDDFRTWKNQIDALTFERALIVSDRSAGFLTNAAALGLEHLSGDEYRVLRVAAGIPSYPEELNDTHNPLEGGLRGDVSFTKGCYVGQEVIARLDSYDKVQRQLVVLRVDGELAAAKEPAEILADGIASGVVTSIGGIFRDGTTLVMGYVARGAIDHQRTLTVHAGELLLTARVFSPGELAGWPRESR